jgi:hypothetical protein
MTSSMKILVTGETGGGKSTFINYLTNYFKNGKLQNLRVAIKTRYRPATEGYAHSETNTDDTTQSQTTACIHYQFYRNGRNYTFLDTPGLSDTRGTNQDDLNTAKIIEAVEKFDGITCVIIVMNGTQARLTDNVQNVIIRLQGFLPDVIMEHVIVVLTNAQRHSANADLKEQLKNLKSTVYPFYMQNSAFSTDPSSWDQLALKALQIDWEASMNELKNLIDLVDTFEVKSVAAFTDMKKIRNDIKSMMHNARLEVENIQKTQNEIAVLQAGMKGLDDDQNRNQHYMTTRTVAVSQLVDASFYSTLCSQCNHVCHAHCRLQETFQKGDKRLSGCACMGRNDRCTVCKGQCSYTQHYHARKTIQQTNQTVQEVLYDIKAKYDAATSNKNAAQQKLTTIAGQKQMLANALIQKNAEIKKKCLELKQHCSGFNIVAELNIMIKQLETSKQMIKDFDALRQAETFINNLTALSNQLKADSELSGGQQGKRVTIQDTYRRAPQAAEHHRQQPHAQCAPPDHTASAAASVPTHSLGKNIYVGGFPEGALNHQDLENYFSPYGTILKCFVAIDKAGKLRNHGFVHFDNYNTVQEIMKKSHTINGYVVIVNHVRENQTQQDQKRPNSATSQNPFGGAASARGPQNDRYQQGRANNDKYSVANDDHTPNYPREQQRKPLAAGNAPMAAAAAAAASTSSKNMWVGGFPEGALNDDDLMDYFGKYGTLLSCFVNKGAGGKLLKTGFVEFESNDAAVAVMNKSHIIKGHSVKVNYANAKTNQKVEQLQKRLDSAVISQTQFRGATRAAVYDSNNDQLQQRHNADNNESSDLNESTQSHGNQEQYKARGGNRGNYRGAQHSNRGGYNRDNKYSEEDRQRHDPSGAYQGTRGFDRGGRGGRGSSRGSSASGGGGAQLYR